MPFSEILTLIGGVLAFPKTILEIVKLLQKTPQEAHQEIVKKINEEAQKFQETGRPKWD